MPQSNAVSHMTLVRARAGCSVQVEACLSQLIEPTLKTPGCLHFVLQHCQTDPLLWQVAVIGRMNPRCRRISTHRSWMFTACWFTSKW